MNRNEGIAQRETRTVSMRDFITKAALMAGVTHDNLHIFTTKMDTFEKATTDKSIVDTEFGSYEILEFIGDGVSNSCVTEIQAELFDPEDVNKTIETSIVDWMTVIKNALRSNYTFSVFGMELGFYRFYRASIGRFIHILEEYPKTVEITPDLLNAFLRKRGHSEIAAELQNSPYRESIESEDYEMLLSMPAPPSFNKVLNKLIGSLREPIDLFRRRSLEKYIGDSFEAFIGAVNKVVRESYNVVGPGYAICYSMINHIFIKCIAKRKKWIMYNIMAALYGKKYLKEIINDMVVFNGPKESKDILFNPPIVEKKSQGKATLYEVTYTANSSDFPAYRGETKSIKVIEKLTSKGRASVLAAHRIYNELVRQGFVVEHSTTKRKYTSAKMTKFLGRSLDDYASRYSA